MHWQKGIALVLGLTVAACTNGQLETTAGAVTMGFGYETVDFALLIDPDGKTAAKYGAKWNEMSEEEKGNAALADYQAWERNPDNAGSAVLARDQIQDRLFGTSNQLCHNYELHMQNLSSQGNFWSGIVTTTAGTAGALFSGGTTQILSAIAAISNGGRAEFNQDFFYKEAVPAIFKGIKASRAETYTKIMTRRVHTSSMARTPAPISDYNLNAAINDAIYYHWNCTLASGIAYLGSLANPADPVGLKTAQGTTTQIGGADDAVAAQAGLLAAFNRTTDEINVATGRLEGFLTSEAKLAPSKTAVMAKVTERKTKATEAINVCNGKVLEVATAVAKAQEALAAAKGAEVPLKQAELGAAASNATLLAQRLQLASQTYADEVQKLSKDLAALQVGANGTVEIATAENTAKEAFKAPLADLGCK